jgi:hypothetical protein
MEFICVPCRSTRGDVGILFLMYLFIFHEFDDLTAALKEISSFLRCWTITNCLKVCNNSVCGVRQTWTAIFAGGDGADLQGDVYVQADRPDM